MSTEQLKYEHKVIYETRLGIMEIWGAPLSWQHNLAVAEADEAIAKLRKEDGIAAKLKSLRESL